MEDSHSIIDGILNSPATIRARAFAAQFIAAEDAAATAATAAAAARGAARANARANARATTPRTTVPRTTIPRTTAPRATAMSEPRPFITCHVLDTTTGKPAAGVYVKLRLTSAIDDMAGPSLPWVSKTDSDGRVTEWTSLGKHDIHINEIVKVVKAELPAGDQMIWHLTFLTEEYFGKGNTFYPEVELRFATKKEEEHYHVPLLLGPWSYTTYRGS